MLKILPRAGSMGKFFWENKGKISEGRRHAACLPSQRAPRRARDQLAYLRGRWEEGPQQTRNRQASRPGDTPAIKPKPQLSLTALCKSTGFVSTANSAGTTSDGLVSLQNDSVLQPEKCLFKTSILSQRFLTHYMCNVNNDNNNKVSAIRKPDN